MNKFLTIFIVLFTMLQAKELSLYELNRFKYQTPNEQALTIPNDLKLIIIAFDKSKGALVNEYLDKKEPTYLKENSAIFIADVSDVPKFLLGMIALPKLKKFKHPIYLNVDSEFKKTVPCKDDKITLLFIQNMTIKDVLYISTLQELEANIKK